MYARVAAFEYRDMSRIDELITTVQERARSGAGVPAVQGFLMLIDRERGTALGIALFETEAALRDSEAAFERMGDEIPEELRGRRTSVDVYEVLFLEGGQGARAARVSSLEGPPERIDEGRRRAEEDILPRARQIPGWVGVLSLGDRSTGRAKLVTLWESVDALHASEEQADRLRKESAEGAGETITGVERYEVAVAERLAPVAARV